MINKDGSILINEWDKAGISSPYVGFQEVRNLDLRSKLGSVMINEEPQDITTGLANPITSLIISTSVDTATGKIYAIDDDNTLYRYDTGEILTYTEVGSKAGICVFKNYLLIVRGNNGYIDVYGPLNSPSVTAGWYTSLGTPSSLNGTVPMIWGQDDILYIGVGSNVASIQAIGTFDPSNSATYLINTSALDLPTRYHITHFVEHGTRLMVCVTDGTQSMVYPWDRASATYDLPLILNEISIDYVVSHGNYFYIMAGGRGRWYISDGNSVEVFSQLPDSFVNLSAGNFTTNQNGALYYDNKIVFGLSGQGSGTNDTPVGIYSLDIKNGAIRLEHTVSTGTSAYPLTMGALAKYSTQLYIAWETTGDAGVDLIQNASNLYDSYASYFISPMYQVSDAQERLFEKIEVILGKPLIATGGIKLEYRKSDTEAFTTIDTITYTDDGGLKEFILPFGVSTTTLQVKVSLTQTTGASPELISIRIS